MRRVLEVLSALRDPPEGEWGFREGSNGINQTEIIIRAEKLYKENFYYGKMKLASLLMNKRIGRSSSPYNLMGSLYAARLSLDPKMKDDPSVKEHTDWVNDFNEGIRRADLLYASYSRSLNQLLGLGFVLSDHYEPSGKGFRHHRARYRLGRAGSEWLKDNVNTQQHIRK